MPVIILLGIFGIWGAISLHESCGKNTHIYTHDELENMMKQIVGKSKQEARKVSHMHRK